MKMGTISREEFSDYALHYWLAAVAQAHPEDAIARSIPVLISVAKFLFEIRHLDLAKIQAQSKKKGFDERLQVAWVRPEAKVYWTKKLLDDKPTVWKPTLFKETNAFYGTKRFSEITLQELVLDWEDAGIVPVKQAKQFWERRLVDSLPDGAVQYTDRAYRGALFNGYDRKAPGPMLFGIRQPSMLPEPLISLDGTVSSHQKRRQWLLLDPAKGNIQPSKLPTSLPSWVGAHPWSDASNEFPERVVTEILLSIDIVDTPTILDEDCVLSVAEQSILVSQPGLSRSDFADLVSKNRRLPIVVVSGRSLKVAYEQVSLNEFLRGRTVWLVAREHLLPILAGAPWLWWQFIEPSPTARVFRAAEALSVMTERPPEQLFPWYRAMDVLRKAPKQVILYGPSGGGRSTLIAQYITIEHPEAVCIQFDLAVSIEQAHRIMASVAEIPEVCIVLEDLHLAREELLRFLRVELKERPELHFIGSTLSADEQIARQLNMSLVPMPVLGLIESYVGIPAFVIGEDAPFLGFRALQFWARRAATGVVGLEEYVRRVDEFNRLAPARRRRTERLRKLQTKEGAPSDTASARQHFDRVFLQTVGERRSDRGLVKRLSLLENGRNRHAVRHMRDVLCFVRFCGCKEIELDTLRQLFDIAALMGEAPTDKGAFDRAWASLLEQLQFVEFDGLAFIEYPGLEDFSRSQMKTDSPLSRAFCELATHVIATDTARMVPLRFGLLRTGVKKLGQLELPESIRASLTLAIENRIPQAKSARGVRDLIILLSATRPKPIPPWLVKLFEGADGKRLFASILLWFDDSWFLLPRFIADAEACGEQLLDASHLELILQAAESRGKMVDTPNFDWVRKLLFDVRDVPEVFVVLEAVLSQEAFIVVRAIVDSIDPASLSETEQAELERLKTLSSKNRRFFDEKNMVALVERLGGVPPSLLDGVIESKDEFEKRMHRLYAVPLFAILFSEAMR